MKRTQYELEDIAFEYLMNEHGGCEQSTCTIAACMRHGLHRLAIQYFVDSGAASDELLDAFEKLGPRFHRSVRSQVKELWKVPTFQCDCNAVLYDPEDSDYHCDSCGKDAKRGAK